MNVRILGFFTLLLFTACSNELRFESKEFTQKSNLLCKENCTTIAIDIPYASNHTVAADSINRKVFNVVKDLVYVNEKPIENNDYVALLNSFITTFESTREEYPDSTFGWDAKIEGSIEYQSDAIVNIEINHYTFTGGAHGFEGKQSLLFDPKTGKKIANRSLFKEIPEFKKMVENKFRKKYNIPLKGNINQTGCLFEDDAFQLPKNIFFKSDGLLLHYNQYEAASYAEGPKTLFLPYTSIKKYLILK
ncbi:MAG: PdaC/SigV domain-containing protein [Flavobacterium sp.]